MAQNKSSLELREFQSTESDRSLYRAINELRIAMGLLPVSHSNSMENQVYDRTILVKIHDLKYSISCRELDMVFSRFGALEQVEMLSPSSQFHSRVCFQHIDSARRAFDSLNHRCVYDYCCCLELFLMREIMIEPCTVIKDSLNDENECNAGNLGIQEIGNLDSSLQETRNDSGIQDFENLGSIVPETQGNNVFENSDISSDSSKLLVDFVDSTELKENGVSDDAAVVSLETESEVLVEMPSGKTLAWTAPVDMIPEVELVWMNPVLDSHENDEVANSNKMCERRFSWEVQDNVLVFDPGILKLAGCDVGAEVSLKSMSDFKVGIDTSVSVECAIWKTAIDYVESLPFDPGGLVLWSWVNSNPLMEVVITIEWCNRGNKGADFSFTVKGFVFDPGGSYLQQWGLTLTDNPRHLSHYLLLERGFTEGLLLIRSIWAIAWPRRCKRPETDCKLMVKEWVWIKQVTSSYERGSLVSDLIGHLFCLSSIEGIQLLIVQQLLAQSLDVSDMFVNSSCTTFATGDTMELKYVIYGLAGSSQKAVSLQRIILAAIASFPYDKGKKKVDISDLQLLRSWRQQAVIDCIAISSSFW